MIDPSGAIDSLTRRVRDLETELTNLMKRVTELENQKNGDQPLGMGRKNAKVKSGV